MTKLLEPDSPSVHAYLALLQGVITRMAESSAQVKGWCVGITAALLAVGEIKDEVPTAVLAPFVIVLLGLLDAAYLSLERDYRDIYNDFVDKLATREVGESALFKLKIDNKKELKRRVTKTLGSAMSWSVLPFYLALLGLAVIMVFRSLNEGPCDGSNF